MDGGDLWSKGTDEAEKARSAAGEARRREEEEEARGDEAGGWWTKESEADRRRGTSLVCKGRARRRAEEKEGRKWQQCREVRQGNDDKVQEGGTVSAVSAVPVRGAAYLRRAGTGTCVGQGHCRLKRVVWRNAWHSMAADLVRTATGAWAQPCSAGEEEAQRL